MTETVDLMCASPRLAQVPYSARLLTVKKLALTIQTLSIIRGISSIQVTTPASQETLEELILDYIRTGYLKRAETEELLQALVLLVRCHSREIYPHAWEGRDLTDLGEMMGEMGEEEGDLMAELLDFFQKLVGDGLLTAEYAAAYLADAVVNYKTSSKRFQRVQRFLLALVQASDLVSK